MESLLRYTNVSVHCIYRCRLFCKQELNLWSDEESEVHSDTSKITISEPRVSFLHMIIIHA